MPLQHSRCSGKHLRSSDGMHHQVGCHSEKGLTLSLCLLSAAMHCKPPPSPEGRQWQVWSCRCLTEQAMAGRVMQVPDWAMPNLALMPLQLGLHSSLIARPDEEAPQEQRLHDPLQLRPEVVVVKHLAVHLSGCCLSHDMHALC